MFTVNNSIIDRPRRYPPLYAGASIGELERTLARLRAPYEVGLSGRWAKLSGRCAEMYIVQGAWDEGYTVLCSCTEQHPARRFLSAHEAVADALGGAGLPGDALQ